jgi:hypothetical protein
MEVTQRGHAVRFDSRRAAASAIGGGVITMTRKQSQGLRDHAATDRRGGRLGRPPVEAHDGSAAALVACPPPARIPIIGGAVESADRLLICVNPRESTDRFDL